MSRLYINKMTRHCLFTYLVDAQRVRQLPEAGFTPWTQWSRCSMSCSGGSQERFRDCYDGSLCGLGRVSENRNCNTAPCPGKSAVSTLF